MTDVDLGTNIQSDNPVPKAIRKPRTTGMQETTKIILEESDQIPPTGLFISHNGKPYIIQPGVEVEVPTFLLGILDDAVMSSPVVDASTQQVVGYRQRRRYNYRRV